ncbi:uncharacterized protein [Cardiocondyla obscurior]|uniref:uncharacterized protein n=1 Tax=Cardiocondyla obscurior TaxID=286306 RepID=UPI0039657D93
MDQREQELVSQAARLNSREELNIWEQHCDEYIESIKEHGRNKHPRLSVGVKQSYVASIARIESLRDSTRQRFVHAGAGYNTCESGLRWLKIDTSFKNRILTGAIINSKYIEPRQFLEDARDIVLKCVRNVMHEHHNVKINTVFNGEFVAGDKTANKSVCTKNSELLHTCDLLEWYESQVIEPILSSLDEFQERDSGWALSRIQNLTVNVNKYNPLHAGCYIKLPCEIKMKRAVISVQSTDNACFAWSVVAALYPTKTHTERLTSYPHYTTVLNLQGIEFPVILKQIKKFENLNNISINVYAVEKKQILPIQLTEKKRDVHIHLLYTQEDKDVGHFSLIKNLSRLMSSQLSKTKNRKYFCDR